MHHDKDTIAIRLPAMVTDPELKEKFTEVATDGFDIETLWSSVGARLGMGASDEMWLYHMESIQEGLEDQVNDQDLLPEQRELSKAKLENWDQYFSACQQIYAHACSNYSMFQYHPVLDACYHRFDVNDVTGTMVLYKEKDNDEDDAIKQALHPTHTYPYINKSSPYYWN